MNACRIALLAVLLTAPVIAASCSQPNPQITVSSDRIARHRPLEVRGVGFAAKQNVSSHLRRADGSEFPVLPILTDSEGQFTHTIDTMILELGTHELWVVDDTSGRTSNKVRFEVTFDYSRIGSLHDQSPSHSWAVGLQTPTGSARSVSRIR